MSEFKNLGEAAEAIPGIRGVLRSVLGHSETALKIVQDYGYQTSETSVRRWRRENLVESVWDEHDAEEELAEDIGDGMGLEDNSNEVSEDWSGFQEQDRSNLHAKLDTALNAVNANPEDVAGLRVSQYQTVTKDLDGQATVHDLYAVKLLVKTKDVAPGWPVVQPATPTLVRPVENSGREVRPGDWQTAVILPDIQAGFFMDNAGELHPTHDPAAISIALQIVQDVNPDLILVGGDGADFPELSKYRLSPAFVRTTQATVNWVEHFVAQLQDIAPYAEKQWLEGNHEVRMSNYIMDNAKAAFGIKRAGDVDGWPVMSLPYLARFEEHGMNYIPGYPAAEFWFNDRLKAMHGTRVNSTGSTVHRYLNDERVSTISFHIHRREWGERTRHTRNGGRTIMAASPGCLCRIDGAVPSTKGGVDLDGVPIAHTEDWQQGLAVLRYKAGDAPFVYEQVAIHHGWAMFQGKEYFAQS